MTEVFSSGIDKLKFIDVVKDIIDDSLFEGDRHNDKDYQDKKVRCEG